MVRRIGAATLVTALLASAVAQAATLYRCQHDGIVRSSCCCPPDDATEQLPALKDASCCDIQHVRPVRAPTTTSPRQDEALTLPAMLVLPLAALTPTPKVALLHPTEARSRTGPPILELKSSRLI